MRYQLTRHSHKSKKRSLARRSSCADSAFSFSFIARCIFTTAVWFSVAVLSAVIIASLLGEALALFPNGAEASFTIEALDDLPAALTDHGIIHHPGLFSLYLSIYGQNCSLTTTTATVNDRMDYRKLLQAFTAEKTPGTIRISFPYGATTDEIIQIFVENGIGSYEGFVSAIRDYPFDCDFLDASDLSQTGRIHRLDGYLYPDTYDFYEGRKETYYLYKMLDRFASVFTDAMRERCQELGLTVDEMVILASMIQNSSGQIAQYEYLSAVFHNRRKQNTDFPYLSCPATGEYAMTRAGGVYTGRPDEGERTRISPYNTFINRGLPPGAICNPSKYALLAALYPAKTEDFFYATLPNGEALFSEGAVEHEKHCAACGLHISRTQS